MLNKIKNSAMAILVIALTLTVTVQAAEVGTTETFKDVGLETKFFEAIMTLAEEGVVSGNGKGYFYPDRAITASEALTMIERKYGSVERLHGTFSEDGRTLNEPITRAEAAYLMLELKGYSARQPGYYKFWARVEPFGEAEAHYITLLQHGYDYLVLEAGRLHTEITRAEFCYMLSWTDNLPDISDGKGVDPLVVIKIKSKLDDEASAMTEAEIRSGLRRIPLKVLSSYVEKGYTFEYYTKEEYHSKFIARGTVPLSAGFYSHNYGRNGKIVLSKSIESTVIHELGHFVGYHSTHKAEIRKLFRDETELAGVTGVANSDYGATNSDEFFAEAFKCYFDKPQALAERAPKTYALIEKMLSDWS